MSSKESATILPKYTNINNYDINLEIDKHLPETIYSLRLVKLETLEIYIKTNFGHQYIRSFKSLVCVLIFFI